MTEPDPAFDPAAACDRLAAAALPANKAALFDALAAAGITAVAVTFDGVGDSGQIESVEARAGEAVAALPAVTIAMATPDRDGAALERRALPLAEALEELAYAFLEQTHPGWEINEGAFGEFIFEVATRTIELDFSQRIETVESYGHSW